MSFRTVVIKNRCKLEYSLNYLVCRGDDIKRINIDEISTLIIENVGVSLTAALLSRLLEAKIKVILCDPKDNPQGELVPYYASYNTSEKIQKQIGWTSKYKDKIWSLIIKEKIKGQANNLAYLKSDKTPLLNQYAEEVNDGDTSNREGHAAKVYFVACFGPKFSRDDDTAINAFLNYGYSIILSAINREIKSFGYLTELGIHHIGVTNPFNLSCDMMEPLRPLVDYMVLAKKVTKDNFKQPLIDLLNHKVTYDESEMFLDNAIHLYVQSILLALNNNDTSKIRFISYGLF
jgi:CRISPR-associated protein Cas1